MQLDEIFERWKTFKQVYLIGACLAFKKMPAKFRNINEEIDSAVKKKL